MGSWIIEMLAAVAATLTSSIPARIQFCACEVRAGLQGTRRSHRGHWTFTPVSSQMLRDFASGYGNRPSLLDLDNALRNPDSDAGPRRYLDNQR